MGVGRVGGGEMTEPKNDCFLQTKFSSFTMFQNICNELSSQGETFYKVGAKTKG